MPQKAHVTSVDAIAAFRSNLINYVSKARPTLEEVTADVLRLRSWLQNEQRTHWEAQVRRRGKDLEEAQQALFSARISNLRDETTAEQTAYHRARRALDEALEKLRVLKNWNREFDSRLDPLVKQMEKLHTLLANDLTMAVAYLAEVVQTLASYASMPAPSASGAGEPTAPAAASEDTTSAKP